MSENGKKKKDKDKADQKIAELEEYIQKLEEKLDSVEAEKQELFEKLQRVSADFSNFQKRAPKQVADSVAYEKKAIIRTILPCLDNFEHALREDHSDQATEAVIKGVKIIYDHLLDALKAHGVERIQAVGKEFDPNIHEAVMQRSEPEKPNSTVLEEFQTGYKINDQVLRPTKVIVNKVQQVESEEAEQEEPVVEEEASEDENGEISDQNIPVEDEDFQDKDE
jgi:molecular chaperone GrpE